jgi:hypothetical protein
MSPPKSGEIRMSILADNELLVATAIAVWIGAAVGILAVWVAV